MQYFTIHHLRMIRYKLLEYLTKVNLFFIINRSIYFPLSNLQVMYLQKQKIKVNWLKVMELTKSKNSFSGNSRFSHICPKKKTFIHICNPRPTFCHKYHVDKKNVCINKCCVLFKMSLWSKGINIFIFSLFFKGRRFSFSTLPFTLPLGRE